MNRFKKHAIAIIISGIVFASVDMVVMAKSIEKSNNIEIVDMESELSSQSDEEDAGELSEELIEENQAGIGIERISNDGSAVIYSGTWGDLIWELDDEGALTISGEGEMSDMFSDGTAWLEYSGLIQRVIVGGTVYNIGKYAFWNCKNLEEITIQNGVTSIRSFAFEGCNNLKKINLPSSLTSIGDGAFSGCSRIKTAGSKGGNYDVEFDWAETIPNFGLCFSSLEEVMIPEGVTSIGTCAFGGCNNLKKINLPSSLTSIGGEAFVGCNAIKTAGPKGGGYDAELGWTDTIPKNGLNFPAIEEITIPNGVTSIGSDAFYGYENLKKITLPSSLISIGHAAFYGCKSLEKISFSEGLTSIEGYAFNGCESLEEISLPEGLISIEPHAFNNCVNLKKVTLPSSLTSIGDEYRNSAFYGCNEVKTAGPIGGGYDVEFGWTDTIPKNGLNFPAIEEITIPNGVTSIGSDAFYGYENLKNITLPSSITSIGHAAFLGCKGLEEISFSEGLTSIEGYAFNGCENLKKIILPSSLTSIEFEAFGGCNGIKTAGPTGGGYDVEFGWTETIPENGLLFPALEEITIPNGITTCAPVKLYQGSGINH